MQQVNPRVLGIREPSKLQSLAACVTQEIRQMLGVKADVLYCQRLLEEEGVCLGAGCENGREDQNYHIRLCVLAPPDTLDQVLARLRSFHLHLLSRFP